MQSAVGTVDAVTTTTSYDANGNVLTLTLMNGAQPQTTTYSYDGLNRKTSETVPSIGDGITRQTTWAYTRANEVRFKREPAGNDITTTYDGFGQATNVVVTGSSVLTRNMTYTDTGKLATVSETENRQGVIRSRTSTLTYDQLDRQITEAYVGNSDQSHQVISGYDLNGNRVIATADVAAAQPGTTRQSQSTFDRANRVVTITDLGRAMGGGSFATSIYHYDQSGNRLSLLRPDGIIDAYTYDALNRVQQATTTGPGQAPGNLYQVSYTYDLVGNRRTALEFTADLGGRDLVYAYDQQYRLTGETETTPSRVRTTTWGYDQAGNRLQQIKILQETPPAPALASTTTTTTAYQVDALNRLNNWTATTVFTKGGTTTTTTKQCTYAYDHNGNQRDETHVSNGAVSKQHQLSWDGLNRLIAVTDMLQAGGTVIFSAEYDARTRRRLTQENTVTTVFRYDGGDAYQELKNNAPSVFFARGSSQGGGIGGVLYSDRRAAAGPIESFIYNPAVGHTVSTVNRNAQVISANSYDAFGNINDKSGNSDNNRLANTKERSASIGLDNHGHRYYNPETGRYISRDPIGYGDGMNP